MSTVVLPKRIADASPRVKTRIATVLYLIIVVAALFAESCVRGATFNAF